jgi:hypothetical protein
MNNYDVAEPLLMAALKLDGTCEVALYHLGILVHRYESTMYFLICNHSFVMSVFCIWPSRERKNIDAAEMIIKKLLAKNPTHGNGTLGMARIMADRVQLLSSKNENEKITEPLQTAIEFYEKSVKLVKEVRRSFTKI